MTTASQSLVQRGDAVLMRTYARHGLELVSGAGCRVQDASGRSYLDFVAGIAVNVLGHGHPAVVEALRAASEGLLHVSNLYWTEPMVRLAERLTTAAGMDRAFFCNSGAEAVESLLKLSRKARPGRHRVVVFDKSFHGRTMGALSLTAQPQYQEPFRPLLPGIDVVPHGDFDLAARAIGPETALVLAEVIQGEGGVRPAPPGWMSHLRACCDRSGALLGLDEVQTGIGRTGWLFAFQGEGVVPDAIATSKALAGGLPMGALLARGACASAFEPGDHASTFGGGPFVASVANAVLDVVLAPGFLEDVRGKGAYLGARLSEVQARHAGVATGVRGRGLMWGMTLSGPLAPDLVALLEGRGLLAVPASKQVLRLVPPLVVHRAEIDEAVALVDDALGELGARSATGDSR